MPASGVGSCVRIDARPRKMRGSETGRRRAGRSQANVAHIMENRTLHESLIELEHEPLDDDLRAFLDRIPPIFESILNELLAILEKDDSDDEDGLNLLRWALMYVVALRDVSRSATLLLEDGSHNRTVVMLRRVAFEYRTRFRYYWTRPGHATTAMELFRRESLLFEKRIGSDMVMFVQDPNFDEERHAVASKGYPRDFAAMCDLVYGTEAQHYYASFYSYPSSLLHGHALMSMDVFQTATEPQGVYLNTPYTSTDKLAGNLIVFLMDFAGDVATAFKMTVRDSVVKFGEEFNEVRRVKGLLDA